MTTPTQTPTPTVVRPGNKPGGAVVGVTAIALALLGILKISEGDEMVPYYDQAGVLTVCMGITGPDVVKGKTYTRDECHKLELAYVTKMINKMGGCIKPEIQQRMPQQMWVALGHWSYNVGTNAFCNSGVNRELNKGNFHLACNQMSKWTFITKPGRGSVNCRDPKEKCGGLPKRRDYEVKMCMGAL